MKPSTGKWIFSTNRDESGWVPQTFILILNEVQSEKKARKDHLGTENYSLSFSKGDTIRIYKELSGIYIYIFGIFSIKVCIMTKYKPRIAKMGILPSGMIN